MTIGHARGHDLTVDATTLAQLLTAAQAKGKVPAKTGHEVGAAGVCGFLENFRLSDDGEKVIADWVLMASHPSTQQLLEVAEWMPESVGLSASFVSHKDAPAGLARISELLGVDLVNSPAANPTGFFADKRRSVNFARRDEASVERVIRATRENLPDANVRDLPYVGAASNTWDNVKNSPATRAVLARLAKSLAGAGVGGYVGYRIARNASGIRPGAEAGLTISTLFSRPLPSMKTNQPKPFLRDEKKRAALAENLTEQVDRHARPIRAGSRETHTVETLAARMKIAVERAAQLIENGTLQPEHIFKSRGGAHGPMAFSSDRLNEVALGVAADIAEKQIDGPGKSAEAIAMGSTRALAKSREKRFSRVVVDNGGDEEDDGVAGAAVKTAAVGAGVAGGLYGIGRLAGKSASAGIGSNILTGWNVTRGAAAGGAAGLWRGILSGALRARVGLR